MINLQSLDGQSVIFTFGVRSLLDVIYDEWIDRLIITTVSTIYLPRTRFPSFLLPTCIVLRPDASLQNRREFQESGFLLSQSWILKITRDSGIEIDFGIRSHASQSKLTRNAWLRAAACSASLSLFSPWTLQRCNRGMVKPCPQCVCLFLKHGLAYHQVRTLDAGQLA